MLLNIGCGAVARPDWLNLDRVSLALAYALPRAVNPANACFRSHVLQHLTPTEAAAFIAEQFRVLRPRGVIRVVGACGSRVQRFASFALDVPTANIPPSKLDWLHAEVIKVAA